MFKLLGLFFPFNYHTLHWMIESFGSGQLTCFLADVGLNIQEAHAFSSVDGFSLDAFVIDGWPYEVSQF